jgi:hypothetical protein
MYRVYGTGVNPDKNVIRRSELRHGSCGKFKSMTARVVLHDCDGLHGRRHDWRFGIDGVVNLCVKYEN